MFIIRLSSIKLLKLFANYWQYIFSVVSVQFFLLHSFVCVCAGACSLTYSLYLYTFYQYNFNSNQDNQQHTHTGKKQFIIRHKNAVLIFNFINIFVWSVFSRCAMGFFPFSFSLPSPFTNRNFMFIWAFPFFIIFDQLQNR